MKVDNRRIRLIRSDALRLDGPVLYWMNRELRVEDNWALLYAAQQAAERTQPLIVLYNLDPTFLGGGKRQFEWKIASLKEVEKELHKKGMQLVVVVGSGVEGVTSFIEKNNISEVVVDFSPLRVQRQWVNTVAARIHIPFYEVDAHNIVPVWEASDKQEYAAYTIRPKIYKALPEFLTEFPKLPVQKVRWSNAVAIEWSVVEAKGPSQGPDATAFTPGTRAAHRIMQKFFKNRFAVYDEQRNDPTMYVQSDLSPYLHYGNIAPQRVALEAEACERGNTKAYDSFIEELVVRRELSDNFCLYNAQYDSFDGFPDWAKKTLNEHRADAREYIYSKEVFERGDTHDALWNAAQQQMVQSGKMHGYMRMYWAKKILEWTESPEDALEIAIYLNDKYELDGRDPNGYAGIAWSIGGVHDRAWTEREVFGKIRYMNANGCRRKFDVDAYIAEWAGQRDLL